MADLGSSVRNDPPAATSAWDIGAKLRARLARELRGSTRDEIARAAAADVSFATALLQISNSTAYAGRSPINQRARRGDPSRYPHGEDARRHRADLSAAGGRGRRPRRGAPGDPPPLDPRGRPRARARAPEHLRRDGPAAGLVHNVGLGVLSLYGKVGLRRTVELATPERPFAEVEPGVFGFTHAELGGLLGRAWKYPDALVIAIGEHDHETPSTPLAALVAVADLLVRENGVGIEPPCEVGVRLARRAGLDLGSAREGSGSAARRRGRAARREERERRLLWRRAHPRLRQSRARGVAGTRREAPRVELCEGGGLAGGSSAERCG